MTKNSQIIVIAPQLAGYIELTVTNEFHFILLRSTLRMAWNKYFTPLPNLATLYGP